MIFFFLFFHGVFRNIKIMKDVKGKEKIDRLKNESCQILKGKKLKVNAMKITF